MENGYPGYELELDSLMANYGSESFLRSILQVYSKDCPATLQRLLDAMEGGDLEQAGKAIHSLANIMGVVGPATSQALIEAISASLRNGQLETAARVAKDLEAMLRAVLISVHAWLDGFSGDDASGIKSSRGRA